MKPLAAALAALLFSGPALPASAQVWNEKTQSYDYVDDQGNVQGSTPASPDAATAAGTSGATPAADAGGAGAMPDPAKVYEAAIASEKESGKTMVWDGDQMVPAPEGFQNPLTPDAMAAGWRPVMSGNEVVGACNGSVCTAQGLQPDLFGGPPASGTTADNLNASTTPPDPAPAATPAPGANPPAPMQWNEQGPLAPGQIRLPPPGQDAPGGNASTPPPAPTPENFEAVNNFVTQNAQNELDGQNGPNSGTGSPSYEGADNPMTGMAFAPDGSGAYDLPPGPGVTGGQTLGPDGQIAQGRGTESTGSTGGRDGGRAINCKEAGNCEAVAQNLIDFHQGLKNSRPEGPTDSNVIPVASTEGRLRASPAFLEAEAAQTVGRSAVAAVTGELAEGASLDDQGVTDAGEPFTGASRTRRNRIPTGNCSQHIMQSVGVCPSK